MISRLRELLFGTPRQVPPPASISQPQQTVATTKQPSIVADALPVPKKVFGGFTGALPEQPEPPDGRSEFVRDEAYENSPGISEALHSIDAGVPAILISGRAGTGKTTLIRYLRKRPGGELQVVVAPTAVAALNASAQTIHSFFHLPHLILDANDLPIGRNFGVLYRRMTRLIIDEISMVRADLIDAIDARLRSIRDNSDPFGGVQLVMVGDFLQLPPVVEREHRPLMHALGYKTPFAFNAHALSNIPVAAVALDQVYRQDERDFIELLNKIRTGEDTDQVVDYLNSSCLGPHRGDDDPLLLTPTRAAADTHNRRNMNLLPGQSVFWSAQITGKLEIDKARLPVPENLELRIGSRVMAAKNDPLGRWINGSLGTVTRFNPNGVFVKFDKSHNEYLVERASWEKIKQVWNDQSRRIENEVIGAYKQIPLVPAWAVTIHKAQGLTLENVRLDLGSGAFIPGQVYVALSRVRSMAGLSLARPLRRSDLQADPMLIAFTEWLSSNERQ